MKIQAKFHIFKQQAYEGDLFTLNFSHLYLHPPNQWTSSGCSVHSSPSINQYSYVLLQTGYLKHSQKEWGGMILKESICWMDYSHNASGDSEITHVLWSLLIRSLEQWCATLGLESRLGSQSTVFESNKYCGKFNMDSRQAGVETATAQR